MGTVVGIQARMSSTRLPRKVLMDLAGKPILTRVWDACSGSFERVILTSRDATDDSLAAWCAGMNYAYRRGSLDNVLSRYLSLAREKKPNILVRVCGDAPFLEKRWIWKAVEHCEKTEEPVFVPNALHCGTPEHWQLAAEQTYDEDREHAGAAWFELYGHTLNLVPEGYFMVNTQEDLDRARAKFATRVLR